jgi:acyl-coenzyme A synthetase/AMP-(fatty) acid ligase
LITFPKPELEILFPRGTSFRILSKQIRHGITYFLVELASGATATETERNYARDHLAHFKCPQRIQFVSELPKTATGKVQKYVLRDKPAISKQ